MDKITEEVVQEVLNILDKQMEVSDNDLYTILQSKYKFDQSDRLQLMNIMIQSGYVSISKRDNTIYYKKNNTVSNGTIEDNNNEQKILDIIFNSKKEGISKGTIKKVSQMNMNLITKIINKLVKKGLVCKYKVKKKRGFLYYDSRI